MTTFDDIDFLDVTGFAFQTTPGAAVAAGVVPEPASSSLALLAVGGVALSSWRRRRASKLERASQPRPPSKVPAATKRPT